MSFTLDLQMAPRLGLEVSPALVMFGEMLVLPYAGMASALVDELADNPALVRAERGACPVCHDAGLRRCPVCFTPAGPPAAGPAGCSGVPDVPGAEHDLRTLARAVRLEVSSADAPIAERLVDTLDEHGLFDRSPGDLAGDLDVDEGTVRRLIQVIQRTGAPGVGATSAAECLLLQLDELDRLEPVDEHSAASEARALARTILTHHLAPLARGHLSSIAAALDVPRPAVDAALDLIRRRLHPFPAFHGRTPPQPTYVVPDVVVRAPRDPGAPFTVELVEPAMLRVRVRRSVGAAAGAGACAPSSRDVGSGDRTGEESVRRAQAFVAQLHDRWETLRRVVEYAVDRQRDFLAHGPSALRPLTRAEVASALDLHESTVSRAVADKFVLLPDRTIVPLSGFFGASGGLDAELRRLLDEVPGPVSDQRLADLLTEAGFPVARRTVAKHRVRLGITSTLLR